jgi:hypothetical protein
MKTHGKPFILILDGEMKPNFVLSGRNHDISLSRCHRRNEQATCIYIERGLEPQADCICDPVVWEFGNVTKLFISMYSPFFSLDWLMKYLKGASAKSYACEIV